jgi:dipeptidyl aminopeptidase/acylaminoacyl peptidase
MWPALVAAAPLEALRAAIGREAARAPAAPITRAALLATAVVQEVTLSPDGRLVAVLAQHEGRRQLSLLDTTTLAERVALPHSDAQRLYWSVDSGWLFLKGEDRLSALQVAGSGGSRVIAKLNERLQHEVAGADPAGPAVVVIERTLPNAALPWSRLLRIGVDGKVTVLHEHKQPIADFALDAAGRLAWVKRIDGDALPLIRMDVDGEREVARCVNLETCSLLRANADGSLMMRSSSGGNFTRLVALDTAGRLRTLHEDPRHEADLESVAPDPVTREPRIAAYRSTAPHLEALDANARKRLASIEAALPGRDLSIQPAHGEAAPWLVIERDAKLQRPRWYLHDISLGLRRILANLDAPAIPPASLAERLSIEWTASDGMRLHGFLTVPAGLDPAQAPLVVSVHGGPWSRAEPGYSTLTQLLANRGYAVFEPNFRGSTGFGRAYTLAAQEDFGGSGRVMRDITEGAEHLLARGIGDRARVGIVGASFGGYAALAGVTFAPQLFRVAVAAVPPTDFGWTMRWAVRFSDLAISGGMPLKDSVRMLGIDTDDTALLAKLHADSPVAHAAALQGPLLLFAGGRDERVAIRSVTHYAATLRRLDKDITLFIEPDAGHRADDRLTREAFLFLTATMLQSRLGGPAVEPADAQLREYLDRSLRLKGSDLANLQ